jgi:adenosylhomocysteine nucleosidase
MAAPPAGVLICFAQPQEAAPLHRRVAGHPEIRILVTGMGSSNSRRALLAELQRGKPALVLSAGFAGALDPALALGDLLFDAGPSALRPQLLALGAREARFYCADTIVATAAAKRALRQTSGADAVEMESAALCGVCREQGIPWAILRAISDTAQQDLPLDFNRLLTRDQRISPLRLAAAVLRSPGTIPALLALRRQARCAADKLAESLARLIISVAPHSRT